MKVALSDIIHSRFWRQPLLWQMKSFRTNFFSFLSFRIRKASLQLFFRLRKSKASVKLLTTHFANSFYLASPTARKWYPVTFLGSIMWIACFSYLMVWWATITGETFGIPAPVRESSKLGQACLLPTYTV